MKIHWTISQVRTFGFLSPGQQRREWKFFQLSLIPVSYTHLDVYKRQDLHRPTSQHTVNQDSILTCLAKNIEPGFYFIPNTPPGVSSEEQQKFMESQAGKPWAQVYYHKSFNTSMSGNMIRGLLVNIVTIFLLCWILLQCKERNLKDTVLSVSYTHLF